MRFDLPPQLLSILFISLGASTGACFRWWLGLRLNALWPTLPLGTFIANCVGGLLMGLAVAAFAWLPPIPLEWRLGLTTGFLGGLTTFSTFSAEAIGLLQAGHYPALLLHVASHVLASLTLTWCGLKLGQWLWA
ncbi:fluoride efflux transporter CrcB [Aquaspirillum soli]